MSREVTQNERFVVVLKVTEQQRLAVARAGQRPAAGRLRDRQSAPGLQRRVWRISPGWQQTEAAHLEFRDDRFVAAFDRDDGADRNITLAYVVRAVTPGVYAHPAASVEDMYRPQFSARTATGMMEVKAP